MAARLAFLVLLSLFAVSKAQLTVRGSTAMRVPFDAIVGAAPVEAIYDPEGTGAGQECALDGSCDIGTGDVPIPDEDLQEGLLHIPAMVGGIAVGFNIEGVSSVQLKVCTIAKIYSGDITSWGDDEIVADNPDLEGSTVDITPIARRDSSGSTEVFSSYLDQGCPDSWALGAGKTIDWPDAVRAVDETSRVVEETTNTNGAIGYAAIGRFDKSAEVAVENADGDFDTSESADFGIVGEKTLPAPDESWDGVEFIFEEGGYPLSFVGFMYVPMSTSSNVVDFVTFVLSDDIQGTLADYDFAPLPENVKAVADAGLALLTS